MSAATLTHPDKRLATLRARMALIGGSLYRAEDDRGELVYVATKWNLTRELRDLDAVESWLDRLGG